jgi:acetylornithine deacetylase/succinyl-diaminopimelate desuccinylase-like protein
VEQEQSRLAADAVVISDTLMFSDDVPSLTISLRGKAHIQVTVHGPNTELHSGSFGGPVGNPVTVLDSIIASLHDKDGHVTVPGFYDGIQTPAPAVVDSIRNLPFDEAKFRKESGDVPGIGGEKGYTALEQMWLRPTLEVIGQSGGFTEKGFQASIPRSAMAKIECRLVPGQDDQKVANAVAQAIKDAAPPTVTVDIDVAEGVGKALVTPTDSPGIRAAAKAMEEVFGKPVSFTGEGGSIPVVETFSRVLKLPTALVGVGIPTDGYHAPNERFSIDRFSKGIRIIGRLWQNLALELTTPERSAQKKVPPPPEPPGQHL